MSFRYYLVSLGSLFLALALGVVLGAGPLSKAVNQTVASADGTDSAAKAQVAALRARVGYDDAFTNATSSTLVTGTLTGSSVVVVVLPGTTAAEVKGVTDRIKTAGASVTGQVTLTAAWADPRQASVLSDISTRLAPPEAVTVTGTAYDQAAESLAAAIVSQDNAVVGHVTDPATALLTGLAEAGFVSLAGTPAAHAQLAVMVAPVRTPAAAAYLPLALALDRTATGAVVGGAYGSATGAGFVAAIRADAATRTAVATQDTADLTSGQVGVVYALGLQHSGGPAASGQYGQGPGATAPVAPRP